MNAAETGCGGRVSNVNERENNLPKSKESRFACEPCYTRRGIISSETSFFFSPDPCEPVDRRYSHAFELPGDRSFGSCFAFAVYDTDSNGTFSSN